MFMLTHTDLLIVALTVLAAAMFALHHRQAGLIRVLESELAQHDERDERLDHDLAALLACSRRIGDRLNAGERARRAMQKQIDNVQVADESQLAIRHAAKLLDDGCELKEVTDVCELSQGEVEIPLSLKAPHENREKREGK